MTFSMGFLGATSQDVWQDWYDAFVVQLASNGLVEGANLCIDARWAKGLDSNYRDFAQDFVSNDVDIIVTGGTGATLACKNAVAGTKIPVVFATAGDPVDCNLVHSYQKPGGNLTGLANQQSNLVRSRLDVVREWLGDDLGTINLGVLGNDGVCNVKNEMNLVPLLASGLPGFSGTTPLPITCNSAIAPIRSIIESAMREKKVNVLYVCTDPYVTTIASDLNELAIKLKLPTMHAFREYVDKYQGLMSYGPNYKQLFVSAANVVRDILILQKEPANYPVTHADAFEHCGNKTTAELLGLVSLLKRRLPAWWL
jgi:putative tryptophan/tyrosine transport system substrate-binding protein